MVVNNKHTDLKVYWNVLKNFLNNIKILSVPAILLSGKTRRNILEKANIFNKLFASQPTPLENSSKLPSWLMNIDKLLDTVFIKKDGISWISISQNSTKPQLRGDSITLPFALIFKSSSSNGVFSNKKEAKYIVKNYRSRSFLPIFANIFEMLLFKVLFSRFENNDLLSRCKSGFTPGESYISQVNFSWLF